MNMQQAKRSPIMIVSLGALLYFALVPPISQDPAYHLFADTRVFMGIPNFMNVISNLPFLAVGLWGWLLLNRRRLVHDNEENYPVYAIFFIGLILTAFGSAYYHWNPCNNTLVWDRLPMTLSFTAFFVAILSEHVKPGIERRILYPLIVLGLFSVIYWYLTERWLSGDLRLYVLIQFAPLFLIPGVCIKFRSRFTRHRDIYLVMGFYGLAKIAEYFDRPIFDWTKISGHTWKHLTAALGAFWVLRMLRLRSKLPQ